MLYKSLAISNTSVEYLSKVIRLYEIFQDNICYKGYINILFKSKDHFVFQKINFYIQVCINQFFHAFYFVQLYKQFRERRTYPSIDYIYIQEQSIPYQVIPDTVNQSFLPPVQFRDINLSNCSAFLLTFDRHYFICQLISTQLIHYFIY